MAEEAPCSSRSAPTALRLPRPFPAVPPSRALSACARVSGTRVASASPSPTHHPRSPPTCTGCACPPPPPRARLQVLTASPSARCGDWRTRLLGGSETERTSRKCTPGAPAGCLRGRGGEEGWAVGSRVPSTLHRASANLGARRRLGHLLPVVQAGREAGPGLPRCAQSQASGQPPPFS